MTRPLCPIWGTTLPHLGAGLLPPGYDMEEQFLTTQDGYILRMFHIQSAGPAQRSNATTCRSSSSSAAGGCGSYVGESSGASSGRPAILMQHALMDSSAGWLILGPQRSLALQLADAGFSVWLANSRGNRFRCAAPQLLTGGKGALCVVACGAATAGVCISHQAALSASPVLLRFTCEHACISPLPTATPGHLSAQAALYVSLDWQPTPNSPPLPGRSRNHTHLSPDSPEFWRFTWDDMATHDMPAMTQHVLSATGREQLVYMGYSQVCC